MNLKTVAAAIFRYLILVGDAISQLLNVALFLGGNPNESISGRAYRCQYDLKWSLARMVIDAIFYPFESHHCRKAYISDLNRASDLIAHHYENSMEAEAWES